MYYTLVYVLYTRVCIIHLSLHCSAVRYTTLLALQYQLPNPPQISHGSGTLDAVVPRIIRFFSQFLVNGNRANYRHHLSFSLIALLPKNTSCDTLSSIATL